MLSVQTLNRTLAMAGSLARGLNVQRVATMIPIVAVPVALGLWQWSLRGIDLRRMNDLGLASVLGVGFLGALVTLTASMTLSLLRPRPNEAVLFAHVVVLILILYGTVPLLVSVPQGTAVYRHLGVADYVTHHGTVDRNIDAYFNWPGFFVLTSWLTSVLGFHSAITVARWGPLVFNLLFLPPLVVFFRVICRFAAYAWLCVWLFFCSNWVGQDSFSPQAFGYLGYLSIVALVIAFFRTTRADGVELPGGARRVSLFALIVLAYVAVTISHQLTPYALVFAIGALVVARATKLYALPVFMIVVAVSWFAYSAVPFFQQFLRQEGRNIGAVSENVNSGLGARLAGTPEHLFVVNTRVAFTLLLWALVPVGVLVRRRMGMHNTAFLALGASAIVLVGLQSYGGEILLRVYLFSLPAVVLFVAAIAVYGRLGAALRGTLIGSLSLALLALFVFARFGNARLEYFSPQEVGAVDRMYAVARPGSLLLAGSLNLPWHAQGYVSYEYRTVDSLSSWEQGSTSEASVRRVVDEIAERMRDTNDPGAYLIFMRSMEPWEEFADLRRAGELPRVWRAVVRSGRFRTVYRNEDAAIYVLKTTMAR